MKILESTSTKANKPKPEKITELNIKIVAVTSDCYGEVQYIAKDDDENYYMFYGAKCSTPNCLFDNDDLWDEF